MPTASEMNGDFGRKSQIFTTLRVSNAPLREFPLEFRNGNSDEKARVVSLWEGDGKVEKV